ncbi:MAG: efflux RND transporter permease subunit [Staphylococcus sp.]|nr:efflux RND transporter permease subunit [Staphylococcus sp.]
MKASSFTVIVTFIALAIVGCALVPLLPVKLAPSQTLPSLTVNFAMPGNSARTVETEVTSRLESVLARVRGVKEIDSKSYNGKGRVTISLDRHADMENTRFEVSALVRQAWSDMPEGVSYPTISLRQVEKEGARPFMTLTLNAPANPSEIQAFGEENLKPALSRITGVNKVELSGAQPMEWKLQYDIDRLGALGLTPADIRRAVSERYGSEFLGIASVDDGAGGSEWFRLSMRAEGDADSFRPEEITVTGGRGNSVTLDKIVTVTHADAAPTGYFRINGLNSIYVNITSEEDANQLRLAGEIRAALEAFRPSMPYGYMIDTAYDATEEISSELDKIYFRTGLTVLILLLFVGLVSLNLKYVLLISIGLAINIAVAVVFYYFTKIEIQLYSLAGITISLNLVIDNLIVMTDHYTRRHNIGAFTAILAATLTTMGALSVVFFMDERTRLSLQDFVTVVIINLSVSLAVALFLVPALVERLGIHRTRGRGGRFSRLRRRVVLFLSGIYGRIVSFIVRFRVAFLLIALLAFGLPVFMIPEKVEGEGRVAQAYNDIFGSSTYKETVRPITDVALGGTLRLFVEKVYNGSYWDRDPGEPVLSINATLPNGATLEQMNTLIQKMERYLGGFSEIRQFQTSVTSARRASISVFFTKEHRYDGFPYRLKGEVISKALTLGGGAWSVYGLEDQGFSNDVRENAGSYRVKLTGYNYDELSDWAYRMRDTLLTHRRIKEVTVASEFSFWKDDYTEFHLAIDRDMLAKHGLTATELYAAIEPTFGREITCGQVTVDNRMENIRLYSKQGETYDIFTLLNQPFTIGERRFKLSDVAHIEKRQAPQDIVKKNQEYVLCLQYEYIGSDVQGEKVLERDLETINSLMPVGYKAESEKRQWKREDESGKYWLLLLVIAIIFFTTSILFNSLRQPFAIILIIPVSFIGVFSIFYLLRLNFDQGGFASFILLAGITVNAAIYLLNEYNLLRRCHPHLNSLRLYMKAFRVKIVPIMLTVLSTILGFIPFIIGETRESFWYPLAIGTMGGLVMSIIAILIIFPIFVLPKSRK